jgi:hypothetical protein
MPEPRRVTIGPDETVYPRVTGPSSTVTERVEQYGRETFKPEPTTSVVEEAPIRTRIRARGPYGIGGSETEVEGVYTSPGKRHYITKDYPEHEITSEATGPVSSPTVISTSATAVPIRVRPTTQSVTPITVRPVSSTPVVAPVSTSVTRVTPVRVNTTAYSI